MRESPTAIKPMIIPLNHLNPVARLEETQKGDYSTQIGDYYRKPAAMNIADALFTRTQQNVLGLLFGNPARCFYTNEILRRVNMGRGTVRRELDRLVAAGLVTVRQEGNRRFYQANPDSPVFAELSTLVAKIQAGRMAGDDPDTQDSLMIIGVPPVPRAAIRQLAQQYHIRRLNLFGSAARGELKPDSDIDLLVEFEDDQLPSLGGMVDIQQAFSELFGGRKVDVATPAILSNPYRQRAIEKDMEELYAA